MSNWLDHSSIVGHLGKIGQKISDPLAWVLGDDYTHLTSDVLPEKVNSGLSTVMKPFDKVDQTINPVRKIPFVNRAANIIAAKPGDAAAIVAGTVASGGALAGAGGGAGGGAAAGGGLAEGGGAYLGETGLTSAELTDGAGMFAGGGDVAGLAAADSAAVDTEGAVPGLTTKGASSSGGLMKGKMPGQQQQRQKKQIQWVPGVAYPSDADYAVRSNEDTIAQSSRTVKTAAPAGAVAKGLKSTHPVDVNGQHILAIRKLNDEIQDMTARIGALKKGK